MKGNNNCKQFIILFAAEAQLNFLYHSPRRKHSASSPPLAHIAAEGLVIGLLRILKLSSRN